ncbi:MAG: NgoMIV family type II restriction endonuclease [bacterium]
MAKVLTLGDGKVPSNADKNNNASVKIALAILDQIGIGSNAKRLAAQSAGNEFEEVCAAFLESTFLRLMHIRPGEWKIFRITQGSREGIARFEQYAHLSALADACKQLPQLKSVLGTDYIISPDVVVIRIPEPDSNINKPYAIVDDATALLTSLRCKNNTLPLIHASVSCKFTLRSDRAQNARSEALNLIRNRKGRVPHIAVMTAEPLPSRLSSLALGTGDIDCVYHFALPELKKAVEALGNDDSRELLSIMIEGKRLRDISDLPLDLAI